MYKIVHTFEILPGKLSEMKDLIKRLDEERISNDPTYKPYKRYINIYGNVHQLVIEGEMEELPEPPVYAEIPAEGLFGESLALMVPGRIFRYLLKELDLS